ncbi:GntR family transcriptional regulator [Rhodococcus sp. 15-649-1-2]|nr:GntR family transcriptional regulator [Rhodococcus sp. 15-649-1-2]OZE87105.1 GntR family transcriptional regulator [Rhodococcus sp. 15-649-1-2]
MSKPLPRAGRLITDPPSLTALAADALRSKILRGELRPGDRVVENRLTGELGVSRPPLREAMRILEQEGLLVQTPRVGAVVTPLTMQDVYEIVTLRENLEAMAVRLGVPVKSESALAALRETLELMTSHAASGREDVAVEDSYRFHAALVALADHRRLEESYRSLSIQLQLCMSMNRSARAAEETLVERAERHRRLFDLVVAGDPDAVLRAMHDENSRSFVRTIETELADGSPSAQAWAAEFRGSA